MRIGLDPLRVVDEAGEDDDAEDEEEDEQSQLLGRRPERLYEDFEAGRVSRQFEQPHDADDGEELEDVGVLQVRGELLQGQIDEEGERRDVVDDVDRGAHEQELVRTGDEAHQDLDREPRVADGLDVEEGLVGVRLRLVQRPRRWVGRRVHRHVPDHRHSHVRVRFQTERQDRDADEEHRYQSHNLTTEQNGRLNLRANNNSSIETATTSEYKWTIFRNWRFVLCSWGASGIQLECSSSSSCRDEGSNFALKAVSLDDDVLPSPRPTDRPIKLKVARAERILVG